MSIDNVPKEMTSAEKIPNKEQGRAWIRGHYTPASGASSRKYRDKNYKQMNLIIRNDSPVNKETIKAAAEKAGESINAYVLKAVEDRMIREGCL